MMTLLYKELRLAAHPASLVFACLGCLVLVPAYPYSVIFLFGCLAPYITFLHARETNDAWYTAVLPVTKRESVLGKCLLVLVFQVCQLVFSVPFALLRHALITRWVWTPPRRGMGWDFSYMACSTWSFSRHFIKTATRSGKRSSLQPFPWPFS